MKKMRTPDAPKRKAVLLRWHPRRVKHHPVTFNQSAVIHQGVALPTDV
jgi:hypothetical protein